MTTPVCASDLNALQAEVTAMVGTISAALYKFGVISKGLPVFNVAKG